MMSSLPPKECFHPEYYQQLASLEDGHFWFNARNRLIIYFLRKHGAVFSNFLEVGCGTGYVLNGLAKEYPAARLVGTDIFYEGAVFAQRRLSGASILQCDALKMPFRSGIDVIGAFDVIEHIEDDVRVLKELARVLRPGGLLLLTVPQHAYLWNYFDQVSCHIRRYSRRDLMEKLDGAGFEPVEAVSFVSLLLPALLLRKTWQSKGRGREIEILRVHPLLNAILDGLMKFELWMIKHGIGFPAGGSLFIMARKRTA